ncbi:MAG: hypothetical protein KAU94_05975 [Verrucomicrobia bacterium]|nr:hypothetical protein [Verrucomicrobiota bacterium]
MIVHLWEAHGLPKKHFEAIDCKSADKLLRDHFEPRLKGSCPPTVLGIILDADENPSSRWDAIKNRLLKAGYKELPTHPDKKGTVIEQNGLPKIGVWIMPDNLSKGMLEDFLAQLAPEDAMGFAKGCVADAKDKGFSSFKDDHQPKAEIHTYLAWQDEPGNPLGIFIDANALDVHLPVAKEFVEFLKKLFL